MMMKIKEYLFENSTLKEMLTGIIIWAVLWQIGIFIYPHDRLYNSSGLWIGIFLAVFYSISLFRSIQSSLDYDERSAVTYSRKKFLLRYGIVCIVFVITALLKAGNLICLFAGLMGIKIGAYLQPFVRRRVYGIIDPPGKPLPEDMEDVSKENGTVSGVMQSAETVSEITEAVSEETQNPA
ncbi:MAG: hypothetical protein K6G22_10830 [Lachnospiraceae bacterium]|nr:hypothetical protein [Lachnospiraceae bacterium]